MAEIATMQLVEQHIVGRNDPRWVAIDAAAFASKNIYNAANYVQRQNMFAGQPYISYETMAERFSQAHLLPDQKLPAKVVQQVLRQLDADWQSFFAASAEYEANPDQFTGRPCLPRYKHTVSGRNVLAYTAQAVRKRRFKRDGVLVPSGLDIMIQTQQSTFDMVRIVPRKTHYVIEVVYTVPLVPPEPPLNPAWVAAGDLGVGTLCALTANQPGFVPLLVNGRVLKSINQRYNKHRASLQSKLPEGVFTSRQLDAITDKRNRRIKTELHRASRFIIDTLVEHGIGTLVVGKNVGWKQNVNLGKRTNQTFVGIPHAQFIDMLAYKAKLAGIRFMVNEESYTSKCSFLDLEPVCKHEVYAGNRVKRGLFIAGNGRRINADVNGSYNILRKAVPNAFGYGITAAVVQPVRVTPRTN